MPNPYAIDCDDFDSYSIWHMGECHVTCVPRYILKMILHDDSQNGDLRDAIQQQLNHEQGIAATTAV